MTDSAARGAAVLYLSYDGLCDPLGRSQILPYLIRLAALGHRISVVSFEKDEATLEDRAEVQDIAAAAGITWYPLRYHKSPPVLSTLYDVAMMSRRARRLHRSVEFDIVHCRSDVPALVGLDLKRRAGVRFIFDMRGFWADERRDSGAWGSNPLHRAIYGFFKTRERQFWKQADQLVSLTTAGRDTILAEEPDAAPIAVIPCCVDLELFAPINDLSRHAARKNLGIGIGERVLGYIGSLGGNYMLEEMLDFFAILRVRYPVATFLFVTHTPPEPIRAAAAARDIPESAIIIRRAARGEVAEMIAAADWGIAFKRPSFSARACSPTKLGEMLALGIPVVANRGVGDVEDIVTMTGGGVLVSDFSAPAYGRALKWLEQWKPDRAKWDEEVRRLYDLDMGVRRYDAIYRGLLDRRDAS